VPVGACNLVTARSVKFNRDMGKPLQSQITKNALRRTPNGVLFLAVVRGSTPESNRKIGNLAFQ
jgi:hypothetical protein